MSTPAHPLRVTVVTETYPPEINGVANTMRQLVARLAQRGHQLQVVRPRQGSDRGAHAGETLVPGLPIPGYPGLRFGLPVYWRLRRQWRVRRPDVVYIATEGPLGQAALMAARASAIPTLTGFHTQFQQYSLHYGLGLLAAPITHALRRFHNRADATLVPTVELRDRLTAQGFTKLQVVGRGVDTALFTPERRRVELRACWGCGPSDPALLYVGRLAAEKNIALVLETFTRTQAVLPNARCLLVGDGPELARLRQRYPQFQFVGAKVGIELAEHYASADLFVFPSLTETFGNVVPEAMASALTVVAFDDAAAHNIIHSGDNGITVDPRNPGAFISAAVAAAQDLERRHRYGAKARTTAETLDWDRVIDAVERCLFDVIHRRATPHGPGRLAATPQ
ncbi:glycosyltransferase family 1 protein [uncultured Thiodictyon sp.]|uniref:glycosyltransferase family 4 protein n=1 Tax=uncultured Thiodictyon sp. TaxID=1846217 RepID=UPI0025FE2751|nr:glycosyltransferase family 1 protein [uncultured Thiodictyon sp.]